MGNVEGIHIDVAITAKEGVVKAIQNKPGLILMDIHLPDMSGNEAFLELQKHDETKNIPVIAISANAMPQDVEYTMELGFKAYLTKPFNIQELLDLVSQTFGIKDI